ncbi:acetyltransferase-like isoleucine patch superfamily enzyme [Leeuwenhoekiella aestuarii]|uniref:CatB-related O-acetyltransferase n=1 Tax=Leeuwenhoekiella aestuarii TaxID=2249426 RepID=UPI000FFE8803|nr:CatB-related O-acetyltransferase [Leeuwenhoekiella aestuarii]RXG12929.1 acetyltransferase-like isoleucine patch superfamily enzyme [Leeuwenhoekiella aestuarii]
MKIKILLFFYRNSFKKFRPYILRKITRLEGGQMYSKSLRKIYYEKYGVLVGYGSYGGCFDKTNNNIPAQVEFGNWCSIAPTIRIHRANHPLRNFTTHPLLYNPLAGYVEKDLLDRPKLVIGHDVWLGEFSTILPNVNSIGNGAIVGASSVVTKDVEPYSIVVGNPAKKIGMRFNQNEIEKLESSKWWELERDELVNKIDYLSKLIN